MQIKASESMPNAWATNERDTNADTCCLGANFVVLSDAERITDVCACDKSIKPIENAPIATGAAACDCDVSGTTRVLVLNEALYCGTRLDHSLINPNQVRAHGMNFWDNPCDEEHNLSVEASEELTIDLQTKGTKIFFRSRSPTQDELESCLRVELTSRHEWNPQEMKLGAVDFRNDNAPKKLMTQAPCQDVRLCLNPEDEELTLNDVEPRLNNCVISEQST